MPDISAHQYDILIAGAGFAGSLTALVLHKQGFKVCLLEKGQHPRFAIGESSTPVTDMILRDLSVKYNLPWLYDFSRYGSWQLSHPEIVCGLKRGFSYFKHFPGTDFVTDANHINELLVAASSNDLQSDTNWLRADFDAFLVGKVKDAGIDYFDLTDISSVKRDEEWEFQASRFEEPMAIRSSFFIDATGGGALAEKLLGVKSSSDDFQTDSFAIFSHFDDLPRWTNHLQDAKIPIADFPYDADDSALHHILDEGWIWVLRFNDRRTSWGFALDRGKQSYSELSTDQIWNDLLKKYPAINKIIKDTALSLQPGKIIRSGRLQRKIDRCFGPGWAVLPHTAGFVDPLFSSGIGHSLAGIEKLTGILSQHWNNTGSLYRNLKEYEHSIFEELKLIDLIVAGCYKTMACFELFNTWSMFYFVSAIFYEQERLNNKTSGYFLGADNQLIMEIVQQSYADLLQIVDGREPSLEDISRFTSLVKKRIEPLNTAGLLDPSCKNMYYRTAVDL